MSLTKVFRKILSVTLVCAFVMQQTGFVFAANVDNWVDLKIGVEGTPGGEYNVTTALTAANTPFGTLNVAANTTVTGASLTQNGTNDTLINVNSSATLGLGNNISGSIINGGTLNYSGASLADGSVTGSGNFNFTRAGNVTSGNSITQSNVTVAGSTNLTNNAAITGAISNSGTIGSTADNLNGTVANDGTLNLAGGTVKGAISGTGDTNITADLTSNYAIAQTNVTTSGTNVTVSQNALLTAGVTNGSGVTFEIGPNNLAGDVNNSGIVKLNADGTLSHNISGNGKTESRANVVLDDSNTISQNVIKVGTSAALTANANNLITSGTGAEIFNDGQLNLTGGTNANVINGDGTTNFTGDAINNAAITQGAVTNTAQLTNNVLITAAVTNTGTLTSDGDKIAGAITNNGSYIITDKDNANDISGASGTLTIQGTTTNTGNISQKSLSNSGTFTSDASLLAFADGIANSNVLNLTGGTNANAISGAGTTNFTNDVVNNATIAQTTVTNDTGTLTNNAAITADFDNNGGTVDNNAAITGTITNTGTITSTADNLVGKVTNDATLNLAGGTVQDDINGTGNTNITADLTNDYTIAQNLVSVSNNATFNNNGMLLAKVSNLSGSTINTDPDNLGEDVANDGTLNFNDKGALAVAVTGSGETNIFGNLENQGSILQKDIYIDSGVVVKSNASDMTATDTATGIVNNGIISYTGGTTGNVITGSGRIDITNYVTNTGDIDQATVSNSSVFTNNGTVDANLTNTNAIEGTGSLTTKNGISSNKGTIAQADLTNNGTFDNEGHITLTGTLTNNDTFNTNADLLTAAAVANEGDLNLTGGTNANVITGAGTTNFSNTVTNNAAITQNTVTNMGTLTNNALITADVTNTGTLTSDGADIDGDIANTGTYIISDGDNDNDIIGAGGKLSILGDTTNTGTIMQETLAIANSGNLTTDSELVIATITNDGKLEWNAGTANENVINGSGQLDITGGDIANSSSIAQNKIKITGGSLTSNADLLATTSGITNNVADGLTLTGGTNTNAIDGTGSLITAGDVANNATIIQDSITVSSGKLTTAADTIATSNGIVNDSQISFTSGDNNNDITGTGTTFIDGTVQNLANIDTVVQVNTGAHYGTATDVLKKLENRGTTDLIDADIASTGKISGTGVTNILGATVNNNSISQSAVNIAAGGSLTTASDKVEAAIANEGDLIWNSGTANTNVISGNGALEITGGAIANSASISQGNITISGGSLTSDADLLASTGGIANDATLGLTGGTNANNVTGTGDLYTSGTLLNKGNITQGSLTNSGNFINDDGTITGDITNSGVFATNGDDVTGDITNSGTYIIVEGDNSNDITGTGDVQIEGTTINMGTIAQDNIFVAAGAEFVAADISDVTTTTGIDNAGTFEMQSGTNANIISGNTGALNITGVVTNNSGVSISQDTIDIATLGDFTADAGDLVTVNGITNAGSLTLGDGNTANNISGNGTLTVTGTVNNTGNISQKSLSNSGTFTSDASLLAFANGIDNSNVLNLTGGTNANAISGAGTTNFTNDVVNNAAITQTTVTNDTGTLTNNAAITADFDNNGGTVNNEAAITGTITNSGTINSTADNLAGKVTSDGTLNLAGGTVQNDIDGTGTMFITDDLINDFTIAQASVTNDANMTNNGAITADFTNNGVVDNSADITGTIVNNDTLNSDVTYLKGAVTNDGTLNANGGITQNTISGTGEMNILADLTAANNITQDSVNVEEGFTVTNNAVITANAINNDGTIQGAASGLVGDIANEGSLIFDAASTGASNISGSGDVQVTADTTLTGSNSFTGGTLIDGAVLTIANQNNLSTGDVLFANSGTLQVTAAGSLDNILKGQAATDNITVDNAAALILNTATGAAKDFHKAGTGAMTFAMASNGYTGNTYVDGGTLVGNTLNINNTVNGAAGTTVEFNDTADAELNGINTLGTFVKSGSALLNVETNAFAAAQVELNSGILAANRAMSADVLNVNNGATLRGNGNITGTVNVNNGGTLAPGNSIDTLTITGDVNFNNGSTTAIEINETPASDKIVISGNANIAGGANLTVSNENGRYFEWKEFEIINAGNVAGTFTYDGTVADYDTSRINVELDYSDPTKVLLTAKRKATNHEAVEGLSRNQAEAARAMDAVSTGFGGDITNALLQLEQLGGLNPSGVTPISGSATLQSALSDVGGVLYANSALATLFNAKTAHVYDRISKRNPSSGECQVCHDNVWAEYYSQYDKVYANDNSPRFTNNMTGVLAGYDRSSDEVLLGVYGGAGKSDLRQRHDTMDIEDMSLGIYAGYRPGNWVFKGTLFGGYQSYHGKRNIDFMARNAEGKYHGWNLALDLEGGYNVALYDWLALKPFVGVLGNYAHLGSFTETGADALNLHVESKNQFNTQARLGVQLDGKVGQKFNWYGSAAVKQFIGGDYAKLHMSLGLPGTRMEIISAELGRTYFSGQVGASYALTDHWSLFGNMEAGVNNKSANCYGNIGLAYTW